MADLDLIERRLAMMTVEMTRDALDAASRVLSGKGPVQMVNLIRYRAQADYGGQAGGGQAGGGRLGFPPCSGREAYLGRYVAAFAQVAGKVAPGETFRPVFLGSVAATVVAPPGEAWDDIAIVEYASFDALRKIIETPEYEAEAAPHRRAALEDWRFVAALKAELPGS
jgi:hypothetical protein